MRLLRFLLCLAFLTIVSVCRHSVSSNGPRYEGLDGAAYGYEAVTVDASSFPIFLLSRAGGPGKDYAFSYTMSRDEYEIDGARLKPADEPTIYFKEDGKLRTRTIPKSGIWLPLFGGRPTTQELKLIFDHLESGQP